MCIIITCQYTLCVLLVLKYFILHQRLDLLNIVTRANDVAIERHYGYDFYPFYFVHLRIAPYGKQGKQGPCIQNTMKLDNIKQDIDNQKVEDNELALKLEIHK